MSKPWEPKYLLKKEQAKKFIEAQFPELVPITIKEFGNGFDNTVYLVNDKYIFRFPRREISLNLIKIENRLLPNLVSLLNIPIPNPIFFGQATEEYPSLFTGYEIINGVLPGPLSLEKRMKSVKPIATFLKKLHSFPIEKAVQFGVPKDELERLSIVKRKPFVVENIKKLAEAGLLGGLEKIHSYIEELQEIKVPDVKILVHGDIHVRNILVDDNGKITGIIDWGDTHIGHPANDLAILYSFFPPEGRELFFHIYGEVDETTKILAKFKAIFIHTMLLLYADDKNDHELITTLKESLALALSD